MTIASPLVERHITSATRKQRARVWLSVSLSFAKFFVVGVLLLGLAMSIGWIEYRITATFSLASLLLLSMVAWGIASLACWGWPLQRRKIVRAIEERENALAERLSTLVHLDDQLARPAMVPTLASPPEKRREYEQQQRQEEVTRWFRKRIENQAAAILGSRPSRAPAWPWTIWLRAAAFIVLSGLTVWFYAEWRPWDQLKRRNVWNHGGIPGITPTTSNEPSVFDIPAPDRTVIEAPQVWGEVRITEPGADLRISRLDVVPLQIEAAASEPIATVRLVVSRNGGAEEARLLPPPRDPTLAVLAAEINAAAMQLVDGDLVVYFAEAITATEKTYRSNSFRLEVSPLLADIEQLPGGEAGETFEILDQAADLVATQSDVVRQMDAWVAEANAGDNKTARDSASADAPGQSDNDTNELADIEARIANAVKAIQARADSLRDPDADGVDSPGENASKAQQLLERAAQALRDGDAADAPKRAREALTQLVELRKGLKQELVADRPNPAETPPQSSSDPAPSLASSRSAEQRLALLDKLREEREREKAAREALGELAKGERQLADQLPANQPQRFPGFSSRQEQLIVELEQTLRTHEQLGDRFPRETQAARGAMRQANEGLRGAFPGAPQQVAEAVRALTELGESQQASEQAKRLRDAFRLKRLMDEQAQALRDIEDAPESKPNEQLESEAKATKELVEQLRQLSSEAPLENSFNKKLRESLDEDTRKKLDSLCEGMCRGGSSSSRGQSAAGAAKTLESLSRAFSESSPTQGLAAQPGDDRQSPSGENPRGVNPRGENPGVENLSGKSPSGENPGGENPGDKNPSDKNPSDKNPSGKNPGGKNPGGKNPRGENPSGESPSSGKPGGKNPSAQSPRGPSPDESIERGFRSLESLARSRDAANSKGAALKPGMPRGAITNNESQRETQGDPANQEAIWNGLTPADRQRLRTEALGRLTAGVYGKAGHNERSDAQVRMLREQLMGPTEPAEAVDWRLVDSLRESLQNYRREQAVEGPAPLPSAETTLIAPESLPPTYRQPVRNYFQKLSEQRK